MLRDLTRFTGAGREQEDDITLVTLERAAARRAGSAGADETLLAEFELASEPGNEREAMERGSSAPSRRWG